MSASTTTRPESKPPGAPLGRVALLSPLHAPPTPVTRWAALDIPTHYLDFGGPADGRPIVLVHGFSGSHVNWGDLAPLLAQRHRVVAIDLLGHGLTRPHGVPGTVRANRQLLHQFIEETLGEPAVLVGNSMGGALAMLEATASPEAVAGAALLGAAVPQRVWAKENLPFSTAIRVVALPGVGKAVLVARRRRPDAERGVRQALGLCFGDPSRIRPEQVAREVEMVRIRRGLRDSDKAVLRVLRNGTRIQDFQHRDLVSRWNGVRVPVLLIHGDRDRMVSPRVVADLAAANPLWRYEPLAGVGHVPMLEVPERTAELILDWVDTAL